MLGLTLAFTIAFTAHAEEPAAAPAAAAPSAAAAVGPGLPAAPLRLIDSRTRGDSGEVLTLELSPTSAGRSGTDALAWTGKVSRVQRTDSKGAAIDTDAGTKDARAAMLLGLTFTASLDPSLAPTLTLAADSEAHLVSAFTAMNPAGVKLEGTKLQSLLDQFTTELLSAHDPLWALPRQVSGIVQEKGTGFPFARPLQTKLSWSLEDQSAEAISWSLVVKAVESPERRCDGTFQVDVGTGLPAGKLSCNFPGDITKDDKFAREVRIEKR